MEMHWSDYRHDGFTWLLVNGKTYKIANLGEALDLLDQMANEMEKPFTPPDSE